MNSIPDLQAWRGVHTDVASRDASTLRKKGVHVPTADPETLSLHDALDALREKVRKIRRRSHDEIHSPAMRLKCWQVPQARRVYLPYALMLIAFASLVEDSKPTYAFDDGGGPHE